MICLANLTFVTSKGRIFGPYGTTYEQSSEEATISFTMESLDEVDFITTPNGQFLSDIKTK